VEDDWFTRLAPQADAELEILKNSAHTRPNSRLSCQIRASDELDGIVVRVPPSQG
jgi:2Fe-2S ferredoxin